MESPITDLWAEYYHLNKDLGWTQEEIGKAYEVDRTMVTRRIGLHELPEEIKKYVTQNLINERQLVDILPLCLESHFPDKVKVFVSQDLITEAQLTEILPLSVDLHFPDKVKEFISQKLITEAQLTEILPLLVNSYFSPWLTTDQIRMKCAEDLISIRERNLMMGRLVVIFTT